MYIYIFVRIDAESYLQFCQSPICSLSDPEVDSNGEIYKSLDCTNNNKFSFAKMFSGNWHILNEVAKYMSSRQHQCPKLISIYIYILTKRVKPRFYVTVVVEVHNITWVAYEISCVPACKIACVHDCVHAHRNSCIPACMHARTPACMDLLLPAYCAWLPDIDKRRILICNFHNTIQMMFEYIKHSTVRSVVSIAMKSVLLMDLWCFIKIWNVMQTESAWPHVEKIPCNV